MLAEVSDAILSACAAVLLVPVAVFTIEVVAAITQRRIVFSEIGTRMTVAILIPAHNEETGISATLRSIIPQLRDRDRIIVVADNCTDETGTIAQSEGAEVIRRTDPENRGKGYALDFGIQHLKSNSPDILIIIDADCQVEPEAIDSLARVCANYQRPVQAQYLMRNQSDAPLRMRIAEFAWIVKNLMRPLGLAKLGLPCQLMGSGMAFPWATISNIDLANSHIVEDMKIGLDMTLLGVAPIFCPDAVVLSFFPSHEQGIKDQRTRWEHGHLSMILNEAPKALLQGAVRADISILAIALDLCVPPLALLGMLVAVFWLVTAIFFTISGHSSPLLITSCDAGLFELAVFAAWVTNGRRVISFSSLVSAGFYSLWKVPVYMRFVFSRQREWVRSKRDKDG